MIFFAFADTFARKKSAVLPIRRKKRTFAAMKNIVFDLGGVVFARDPRKCNPDFLRFFEFVRYIPMPEFWDEYDRGALTYSEVRDALAAYRAATPEQTDRYIREAIDRQEPVAATERLIGELKAAGYRLYVLSNMSREFIAFLRRLPVYRQFDGEVVSCEEAVIKPEPEIYRRLLTRFGLDPSETLFIDDRQANIDAAAREGIHTQLFDFHDPEGSCDKIRRRLR